ncbi:MAG: hypothetical protein OXI37_09800 [Gammaproteobacteria bacterium]|nr:hypothetical protein [Gammaproteobacteria bacterium]
MGWLEISKGFTRQRIQNTMAVVTGIDEEAAHGTGLPATCTMPLPLRSKVTASRWKIRKKWGLDQNKEAENDLP